MSNIDRQRIAAVRKLEEMGFTFYAGQWMPPADMADAPAVTDTLHALLVQRADALMWCPEESVGACELAVITEAIDAYEAARWPTGGIRGGKG